MHTPCLTWYATRYVWYRKRNNIDYPEAHDVTAEVDSYTSDSREWISASGVLSGNNVTIDGAVNSVSIIDAPESLNLAALNGHKVTVYGYFDGVAAPALRIQAARIEDKGVVEVIYFSEDFEWLLPWAENSGLRTDSGKRRIGYCSADLQCEERRGTDGCRSVAGSRIRTGRKSRCFYLPAEMLPEVR